MFMQVTYPPAALVTAGIPAMLPVEPANAWLMILLLLTICCAVLGALTTLLSRDDSPRHVPAPTPPRPGGRRRSWPTARQPGGLATAAGAAGRRP